MDISDNYDAQQPQQQPPQGDDPDPQQQQQMQCDPYSIATAMNGLSPQTQLSMPMPIISPETSLEVPMQTAIPLPLPLPPPPTQSSLMGLPIPKQAQVVPSPPAPPASSNNIDIDSLLLQQFSCLGTTDHEDLISQFLSLMNNQMNEDSARFFLEMSNWNLQTAVGCYLDFCNFQTLPSMKIVQQSYPSESQQAWRLQNDGNEDWPTGCYLISPSQKRRIEIPTIKPGDTCDILADIPPTQPAVMWRLCTPNGWYFGETIWMIPPGTCQTQADLANRMANSSGTTNPDQCPQVNVVISVNME